MSEVGEALKIWGLYTFIFSFGRGRGLCREAALEVGCVEGGERIARRCSETKDAKPPSGLEILQQKPCYYFPLVSIDNCESDDLLMITQTYALESE